MNGRMILYLLGRVMLICSGLMLFPLFVVFLYREPTVLAFLIPILLLAGGGLALSFKKPRNRHIYTREGFLIVALSWIVVSLFWTLYLKRSPVSPPPDPAFFLKWNNCPTGCFSGGASPTGSAAWGCWSF